MEDWRREVDTLFHLLDQEVTYYHQLIGDAKEEGRCLRSGNTEALIRTVRAIEERIQRIRRIEEEAHQKAQDLLRSLGKGGEGRPISTLLPFLPPAHRSRLSSYQKEIDRLKAWLKQVNDQNVTYIRDFMDLLSSLIRPMAQGDGTPSYYPGHRPLRATVPAAFNQEV